jgi:hypothetical protein
MTLNDPVELALIDRAFGNAEFSGSGSFVAHSVACHSMKFRRFETSRVWTLRLTFLIWSYREVQFLARHLASPPRCASLDPFG